VIYILNIAGNPIKFAELHSLMKTIVITKAGILA